MHRNTFLVAAVGSWLLFAVQMAGGTTLEFAIGGWMQTPSGVMGYDPASENDLLDVEENLNYGEEVQLSVRASVRMPFLIPNIYLMTTPLSYYADGTSQDGFKFGETDFGPGAFFSETDLQNVDIGLFYGLPFLKRATSDRLNVDFGLNLRLIDYDLEFSQAASNSRETQSGLIPVPMGFLAVQFRPFERLSLEAEGRGIAYSDNEVYSLIGRLAFKIVGPVFVAGGYRYEKVKLDEDGLESDVEFSGPFLEVGLSL